MRWPATWLNSPKAYLWILLLAALVSLPSLNCGWMNDDYLQNLIITGRSTVPEVKDASLFGQFSFVSGSEARISRIIDL
ncbi:MAG TPA: hypothetical protein VFM46_02835, partial [Pseudomonadales bacterium]|nr:hypothetical protein [Pseudomonadales bacterium]